MTDARSGLAVLLCGICLFGASSTLSAGTTALVYVVAPPAVLPGQEEENAWLGAATREGLKNVLERIGAEVVDAPETRPVPPDPSQIDSEAARAWLGPTLSERVGMVVFSAVSVTGGEAILTLHPVATRGENRIAGHEIRGPLEQFPSMVVKGVDYLLQAAGVDVPPGVRERAIRDFTTSTEALAYYARAADAADPQEKVTLLRSAVAADPAFPLAWMQLGLVHYSLDDRTDAVGAFSRAVELDPDFKEAYNDLGVVLGDEGDPAPALKALRKALDIDDGYVEARFNLAKLLDRSERENEALEQYERVLKDEPERHQARFFMALVLDRLGKPERALEEFRYLSVRDPEMAERFFLKKGREARQEKQYDNAQRYFQRARDINPAMPEIYREEGITSYLAGEYEKALAQFQLAAAKLPDSAEVQHYLGLASARTGRPGEAETAFRRSLELENLKESSLELGRLYLDEGRYAEAIASLNRYLKAEPGSDEAAKLLAQVTRKAQSDTETMQKKSDFAIRRLDKMEEIVRDLNRRNAELETRLTLVTDQAAKYERAAEEATRAKATLEADLARKLAESSEGLAGLNRRYDEAKAVQDEKLASLERDLDRERKARKEAEDNLSNMVDVLKTEGKVNLFPGATKEDATETRLRVESLQARIRELEFGLEKSRAELSEARLDNERLISEHRKELAGIGSTRAAIEAELVSLKAAYDKRLNQAQTALEEARESAAAEKKALTEALAGLQGERDELRSRFDKESARALEERQRLEDSLSALKRELKDRAAKIDRLSEDLGATATQLEGVRQESAGMRESLSAEAGDLQRKLGEATQDLQKSGEREAGMAKEITRLREDLAENDRSWQSKYGTLQEAKTQLEKEGSRTAERAAARIKDLESKLEKENRLRQDKEKELGALGDSHRLSLAQQEETLSLLRKTSNERDELKAALQSVREAQAAGQRKAEAESSRQKEQLAAREADLATARRQRAELEKNLEGARITIGNLERESADARKRAEAAEERSSQLQAQLKTAGESLKLAEKKLERVLSDAEALKKDVVDHLQDLAAGYESQNNKYNTEHILLLLVQLQPNQVKAYDDLADFYYRIGWPGRSREIREKAAALRKKGEAK